jgi:hypothetical protein
LDVCKFPVMSYTADYIKSKLLKELEAIHVEVTRLYSANYFTVIEFLEVNRNGIRLRY